MLQGYRQHLSTDGDQSCLQNTGSDLVGLCHHAQKAGGRGGVKIEVCW